MLSSFVRLVALGVVVFSVASACGSSSGTDGSGGEGGDPGMGGQPASGGESTTGGYPGAGGGTGGSSLGGMGGAEDACGDGATRDGSACGLNARGTFHEVCDGGDWVMGSTCDDPDECVDDEVRNGDTACGNDGVLVEACTDGHWTDTSDCNDTGECDAGDSQAGTTSCGYNGRGTFDQECVGGFWQDTDDCDDPDECTDTAERVVTDVCGHNERGDQAQVCVDGFWQDDGLCDDPDVCADGDTRSTVLCWQGTGVLEEACEAGAWVGVSCVLATIQRASVASSEVEGNDLSDAPSLSADGRYVAFHSEASNLVPNDTNTWADVFVRDLEAGTTTRVSVDSAGVQGNAVSANPSISADGRYVAFASYATNLAGDPDFLAADIYVHDRVLATTTRVSVSSAGTLANGHCYRPSISGDGRYVAFYSNSDNLSSDDTNGTTDIFVHDRTMGETTRVSVPDSGAESTGSAEWPSLSADGRYVAFHSDAADLVSGDNNGSDDVFVHDRTTGSTTRVSVSSAGAEGIGDSRVPRISADGRYVAFESVVSTLVSGDTNGSKDVFVHDRTTGSTVRANVSSAGAEDNGTASNPTISGDGRFVAFASDGNNLVSGDTTSTSDIFVRDLVAGTTLRLSVNSSGTQGNADSYWPRLAADGRHVGFQSMATNLLDVADTNSNPDVFVSSITWP